MPPDMAVSMRHTKLKAEEAALLAGELKKPTWESRNEGIHERVSFEDSIWGFDLAGGSYYKTPLRVTFVKPDSRAAKAGIRPGDKLKRINDIDTSTLTIQEAHEIIIESGIHLKLAVTAPEDEEDAYFCYEDPVDENGYDSDEERRREEERARKRQVHARVSHFWSLQWPWVSKRRIIYRESNCFMVPSKFEDKHRDKFPPLPVLRESDDFVLDSLTKLKLQEGNDDRTEYQKLMDKTKKVESLFNGTSEVATKVEEPVVSVNLTEKVNEKKVEKEPDTKQMNGNLELPEKAQENTVEVQENTDTSELEHSIQELSEDSNENVEDASMPPVELAEEPITMNGDVEPKEESVINELLNGHDEISEDDEKILDSILNEHDR